MSNNAHNKLIELITKNGGRWFGTGEELAELLEISKPTVHRTLTVLAALDLIEYTKRNHYTIAGKRSGKCK